MRMHYFIATAIALAYMGNTAQAETLRSFVSKSAINGQIRSYYFNRMYGDKYIPNADAFSLGGMLNVKSASFMDGFSLGVSFFTANALGSYGNSPATVDTTLMGINSSINALGQAYIQYAIPKILVVRAGDQEINTPWMNGSDSRILPATYQGIFIKYSPINNVHIYGMRIFRWKSRTSGNYYKDNLYYKTGYDGDPIYGGGGPDNPALLTGDAPQTSGALAFGAETQINGINAQAWFYKYYQFAQMYYTNFTYTLHTGTGFNPFSGVQYVRETDSKSILGNINNVTWGVVAGIKLPHGAISWGYNSIAYKAGTFGDGSIVSPYTVGYVTDPLYSSTMLLGLVEQGPGHGWTVKFTYDMYGKRLHIGLAYGLYKTYRSGTNDTVYADIIYSPGGIYSGLSLRDRAGIANGQITPGNRSFIYNRIMLAYNF